MKTPSIYCRSLLKGCTIAALCLFSLHEYALADNPHGDSHDKGNSSSHKNSKNKDSARHGGNAQDRQAYYTSRPRSTFTLSLGDGYAGRGYYYGPSNSSYYYERPEVMFYATREAAPREYYSDDRNGSHSTDAAVQQALSSRGYYHGSIDGQIGARSRQAILNYQRDKGLRETGRIDSSLLRSLGI